MIIFHVPCSFANGSTFINPPNLVKKEDCRSSGRVMLNGYSLSPFSKTVSPFSTTSIVFENI